MLEGYGSGETCARKIPSSVHAKDAQKNKNENRYLLFGLSFMLRRKNFFPLLERLNVESTDRW